MALTPARRRGVELLDDPHVDEAIRARALSDVARSNRWLGGRRALRAAIDDALRHLAARDTRSRTLTCLDVGIGAGDLSRLATERAARAGVTLRTLGIDLAPSLARAARDAHAVADAAAADAPCLPLASRSIDLVICSQLLHHFEDGDATRVLAEMHRVTKGVVVVADLRRSWLAAIGFWLVSWILRFHRVTRHDGVVSVLRGFTAPELESLIRRATGTQATVRRHLGWRLTAMWSGD